MARHHTGTAVAWVPAAPGTVITGIHLQHTGKRPVRADVMFEKLLVVAWRINDQGIADPVFTYEVEPAEFLVPTPWDGITPGCDFNGDAEGCIYSVLEGAQMQWDATHPVKPAKPAKKKLKTNWNVLP